MCVCFVNLFRHLFGTNSSLVRDGSGGGDSNVGRVEFVVAAVVNMCIMLSFTVCVCVDRLELNALSTLGKSKISTVLRYQINSHRLF